MDNTSLEINFEELPLRPIGKDHHLARTIPNERRIPSLFDRRLGNGTVRRHLTSCALVNNTATHCASDIAQRLREDLECR